MAASSLGFLKACFTSLPAASPLHWSHAADNVAVTNVVNGGSRALRTNPFDILRGEWALSNFHLQHTFSLHWIWEVPAFREQKGALESCWVDGVERLGFPLRQPTLDTVQVPRSIRCVMRTRGLAAPSTAHAPRAGPSSLGLTMGLPPWDGATQPVPPASETAAATPYPTRT
jgi:hypothetical protein